MEEGIQALYTDWDSWSVTHRLLWTPTHPLSCSASQNRWTALYLISLSLLPSPPPTGSSQLTEESKGRSHLTPLLSRLLFSRDVVLSLPNAVWPFNTLPHVAVTPPNTNYYQRLHNSFCLCYEPYYKYLRCKISGMPKELPMVDQKPLI